MTLIFILVILAALALIFILVMAFSRGSRISLASLNQSIQPIDIAAFRNLVDPEQHEYLRSRLRPVEFRTVQRERLHAMAAYVQVAGRNAAILTRMGQIALAASDPHTAEAAHQLVENALLLRRNAVLAVFRIYLALAWPNSAVAASPILEGYEQLNGSAMLLGRLQNPAASVRI